MPIEDRLAEIEAKLKKHELEKKDGWDKFKIVSTALIPLAIAFAGNGYAKAMKEAEIRSQQIIADGQLEVAHTNTKIAQARTVASFFEALLSKDPARRTLAVKAVLIALPVEGPRLVQVVETTDKNKQVRAVASAALANRRATLIQELFSDSSSTRKNAYEALLASWGSDSSLVLELIEYGRDNSSNLNGIYNTLVLLSHMSRDALRPHVAEIEKFSREVEGNGVKTKERAEKLRSRLPR
ncbi:MAG: hypothetical protein QNJ63_01895 [Calothrix sp. MO_192.B10]|nr:hypothetical protein [Calothrix sp. MO_192.B10]